MLSDLDQAPKLGITFICRTKESHFREVFLLLVLVFFETRSHVIQAGLILTIGLG